MESESPRTQPTKAQTCSWCTANRSRFFAFLCGFFAIVCFALSASLPPAIRSAVDSGIRDSVLLTPQSQRDNTEVWRTFRSFKDPDAVPLSYSVYLWNVTNPSQVINGEKPIVHEVGPYVFKEIKERLNATFETDFNGHNLVKFWEWTYYILDTDKTPRHLQSMDQSITSVSFLFFGFAEYLGIAGAATLLQVYQAYCQSPTISGEAIEKCAAFQTRTAAEFMFGYSDAGLQPFGVPYTFGGLVGNVSSLNLVTMEGAEYMEMYTGEDENVLSRQYKVFNGMSSMMVPVQGGTTMVNMWATDLANRISGTDGSQFGRNPSRGGTLSCWVSELNREVALVNINGQIVTNKGIHLQRYLLEPHAFLNTTQVPSNSAYYSNWANGVLNVAAANQYIPIYMSRPNCLEVDQRICDKVIGFHPDRALHETFVDVEPHTGITFHAAKRLQANIRWPKIFVGDVTANATWFSKIDDELLLPIFWVEESGEVPDKQAKDFKNSVYLFNDIAHYGQWTLFAFGNFFIVLSLFLFNLSVQRSCTRKTHSFRSSEPFIAPDYHNGNA